MNKLIKILGIVAILLTTINVKAQVIEFDAITYDFGEIPEEMGNAIHDFKFTNKGDKPLVINSVHPGCSCTVPNCTKEPVKPGETGTITASYRTAPGAFNKNLTVSSNGSAQSITLYIKGNVVRKPEDLKATHPQTLGKLNVKNMHEFIFQQINSKQTSNSQYLEIANTTDANVNISFENVPEHLIVTAVPPVLEPNKKGQITVSVCGEKAKHFGFHNNEITVKTNDVKEKIKVVDIVAEAIETPANYPVCEFGNAFIDLGTITVNKTTGVFSMKNIGNADLVITSFTTDNPLFMPVSKKAMVIKSGKSGEFKFSSANLKKGENAAQMYLCTNDPMKSLLRFAVKVVVN